MNDSTIAVRYARALFLSATENGTLDEVREDMDLILDVSGTREFKFLLESPVISVSRKLDLLYMIFSDNVQPATKGLLKVVVKNNRELFLPDIARKYHQLYKSHKGIRTAHLVSAREIQKETQEKILSLIREAFQSEIELTTEQNAALIGGFLIRTENLQYDASIATSLRKVKKQLLK